MEDLTVQIVDGVHHTPEYQDTGIPFVTVKNLTACDGIDFTDINYISEEDHLRFCRRAAPSPGDVLVTKDGTLGVARMVTELEPQFSIFVSVALLRPNRRLCLPELIWLFFDSGAYLQQLGRLSAGTGLRHIHLEHFRKFRVKTPPEKEQTEVFRRLDAYEGQLAKQKKHCRKLCILKAALMQDLLTGKVRVKLDGAEEAGDDA